LEGGQNLLAERLLYAVGRAGNTSSLNLGAAGLLPDEQGCLWCNEWGQTWVKHIYGLGDVVGFPALASESLSQSRRVIEHLFGKHANGSSPNLRGVLTSPELAMVGATEEKLRHDLVAYEVGVAQFADTSCGQMSGLPSAMLKLLFHRESFELLGVHCLSESATDLIRLGEMVMSLGGTIASFRDQSISDAPLSECYRQAAEDGFARVADGSFDSVDSYRSRTRPRSRKRSSSQRRLASSPR
jgi:NAD(P) transhydrogenase